MEKNQKQLKDFLGMKFKYEPISFEEKKPYWMVWHIEKNPRAYNKAVLLAAAVTFIIIIAVTILFIQ